MAAKSAYMLGLEGEIERDPTGKPKRIANWEKETTDAMGRSFNPKLHGKTAELDGKGYLKVLRRDAPKPMQAGTILDDTLKMHKTEGYAYYYANAKPGRIESMQDHDWEVVQGRDGPVQLKLTRQQETSAEHTVLMRKPAEWYQEDQEAKRKASVRDLHEKANALGPQRPDGVGYGDGLREDNPLR